MSYAQTANAFDGAGIQELSFAEIDLIAAGDAQEVANGVAVYGGATMALLMFTGPVGWGIGAAYLVTCAAAGVMIGEGLTD